MRKSGGKKIGKAKGKRAGMEKKEDRRINVQVVTQAEQDVLKQIKKFAIDEDKNFRTLVIEALTIFVNVGPERLRDWARKTQK